MRKPPSSRDVSAWTPDHPVDYADPMGKSGKEKLEEHEKDRDENWFDEVKSQPRLKIDRVNPHLTVCALEDILSESNCIYESNGLVEIVEDQLTGRKVTKAIDVNRIILLAHQQSRPYVVNYAGEGSYSEKNATVPKAIASMMLSSYTGGKFPHLKAIISTPLLSESGSISCGNGYDPDTCFYLDHIPEMDASLPARPTLNDAQLALNTIRKAINTFPFADADTLPDAKGIDFVDQRTPPKLDESSCITALMTAVVRPSLSLSPAILITAAETSGAGTGKGKLARCMFAIAYGHQPSAITAGPNSEELEKRLAANLISGCSCVLIDNANSLLLKSDLLASVITENPSQIRLLGQTRLVNTSTSCLIVITGNGLRVTEDLARRFMEVRLDAGMEDPETRPFAGDIVAEIAASREKLLAACLTIFRFGRQNNLPGGRPLGGFEQWCRWVRDPLLALVTRFGNS